MLSLYLTSYSLRKDVPEGNGGSTCFQLFLLWSIKLIQVYKNNIQMKTVTEAQSILLCDTNGYFIQYTQSHCALLWQKYYYN